MSVHEAICTRITKSSKKTSMMDKDDKFVEYALEHDDFVTGMPEHI